MSNQKKVTNSHQPSSQEHIQSGSSKFFLLGFLAVCIITTLSVVFMNFSFSNAPTAADKDGVPELWANAYNYSKDLEAFVETYQYDDTEIPFIEYRYSLTNYDSHDTTYLTHIASFISSETNNGFVPLDANNIEYTYTPDNDESWKQLAISAPANSTNGFRLSEPLAVGANDTPFSTIYLRYNVAYDSANDSSIDAKISAITAPNSNAAPTLTTTSVSIGNETVDRELAVSDDPAISSATVTESPLADTADHTAPLGVSSSFLPDLTIIGSTLPQFQLDSYALLGMGQIVLMGAIAVLVISLVIYLITFKRPAHRSKQQAKE